jgi:hypothetical protein
MSALFDFFQRFGDMMIEDQLHFWMLVAVCLAAGFLVGRWYSADSVAVSEQKASLWKDMSESKKIREDKVAAEKALQKRLTRKQKGGQQKPMA